MFRDGQDLVALVTNATPMDQSIQLDFSRVGEGFCIGDLEARTPMLYQDDPFVDVSLEPWEHKVYQVSLVSL